jgi:predicted Zn-dependent protease
MVPAVAVLAMLSVWAVRWGAADLLVNDATREINTWAATRATPGIDTWMWVRADLQRAARWAETDPQAQELLGVLHLQRSGRAEFPEVALEHFRRALELRPTSPYTWANVAEARYRLGMTSGEFERILVLTHRLGPSEPETQRLLAELGLAMWDEVGAETKAAVRAAVAAGMRRNPLEILQISARRGRLSVACPHVPGDKRLLGTRWVEECRRMAT